MPERIPQSVALRVPLQAYLAGTADAATGKTIAVTISKNGAAYGNPSAGATNATEIGSGSYYVDLSTTDTGTQGPLFVKGSEGTIDDVVIVFQVVPATNGGWSALPAAAADAAGGLIISDAGGLDADAMRSDVAAILVDTGTTLQGELDGIQADTEDIQTRLGSPATSIAGDIAALNDISAADVWAAATRTLTSLSGLTVDTVTSVTDNVNAVLADTTHGGDSARLKLGGGDASNPSLWCVNNDGIAGMFNSTAGTNSYGIQARGRIAGIHGYSSTIGSNRAGILAEGLVGAGTGNYGFLAMGGIGGGSFLALGTDRHGLTLTSTGTGNDLHLSDPSTNMTLAKTTNITGFNDLDAAGVRAALGMASASYDTDQSALNTKLDAIDDYVDTEIAEILSRIGSPAVSLTADIAALNDISAADVWAAATRTLTAGTNIVLAKGVGVTGFNDVSTSDLNAATADAEAQLVKVLAAVYDSVSRSGSTLTLSNGATQVIDASGRTTTG